MKQKTNSLLIVSFFLIIVFGNLALIRTPKETSTIENRTLNKFEQFTISNFINGSYQNNLENAFTDQFIGSGSIKVLMNKYLNIVSNTKLKYAFCENEYLSLGYDNYMYNCHNSIVKKPVALSEELKKEILNKINSFNYLNEYTEMYYYYIPTSETYDFKTNNPTIDVDKLFAENMIGDYHYSSLQINSFDDYANNFYKTDHHWNHIGSYNGYLDIMKMLNVDETIKPTEEVVFDDIQFYGSSGRKIRMDEYKDTFTVYKFDFPELSTTIDGIANQKYGYQEEYYNNDYNKTDPYINHYGMFYGDDYGEIKYTNDNQDENILIISNSFSNAVNNLIASHFNNTYVIDLRYYEKVKGFKFDIKQYIKDNDIDKTLILMNYYYLESELNDMEVSNGI